MHVVLELHIFYYNYKQHKIHLHIAAERGHSVIIDCLCDRCPDIVNAVNKQGQTPLHVAIAIATGNIEVITRLLALGADPNIKDNEGRTCLHVAAAGGYSEDIVCEIITYLCSKHPNIVNAVDKRGQTPLHIAAATMNHKVIQLLIAFGADPRKTDNEGRTFLHVAAARGDFEGVACETITDICKQYRDIVNAVDKQGQTPLHIAAATMNHKFMKLLIALEADPSKTDNEGRTFLHVAATRGDFEDVARETITDIYRQCRGIINAVNKRGHTPLHIAAATRNHKVFEWLIAIGADPNIKDNEGRKPLEVALEKKREDDIQPEYTAEAKQKLQSLLYEAAANGKVKIVKNLINKYPVDCNQANDEGQTPLFLAAANWRLKVVALLIAYGADPNKADDQGRTPLHIVTEYGHYQIVAQLLEHGADSNKADDQGRTPLYVAAIKGSDAVVQILLDHGAKVNTPSKVGEYTALFVAVDNGHYGVVQLLCSQKGVELNQIYKFDGQDATLLDIAIKSKFTEIAKYLISKGAVKLCDLKSGTARQREKPRP